METITSPSMIHSSTTYSDSIYSPLLISMVGIVGTCIAIIAYHLFLVHYCIQDASTTPAVQAAAAQLNADVEAGQPPPAGIDEKVLQTIPIVAFAVVKGGVVMDQDECVVCLGELEDDDKVRLLPNCKHAFHVQCIDRWFAANASCPLCRSPVVEENVIDPESLPDVGQSVVDPAAVNRDSGGGGETSTSAANGSPDMSPRTQPPSSFGLLRHCASAPTPAGRRTPPPLKRSLSMDQTSLFVVIDVEGVNNSSNASSSSASSSSRDILTRSGSLSQFDRVSTKFLSSFSRLRLGTASSNPTFLPY